jgi:hypothetical protein
VIGCTGEGTVVLIAANSHTGGFLPGRGLA